MASLLDPVERWAGATPDAVALRDARGDVSYAVLSSAARRCAAALADRGVRHGDRVLLLAPAAPEFVVAYLGLQAAGAVVVPMNTVATGDEIGYVLADCHAVAVLAWHELGTACRDAARVAGVPWHPVEERFWESLTQHPADVVDRGRDDTAAVLYTSGTTGSPKGAEITVGNVLSAVAISQTISGAGPEDSFGTALPLFHIFGQIAVMMASLSVGAQLSLVSPFTPAAMLDRIRDDRLTVIAGVPTMWNALLVADTGHTAADLRSVRLAISGGAALPARVLRDFQEHFGCQLVEGYGMTETTALATLHRGAKPGSVGGPVARTRVEVRGADGRAVPVGEVGEVQVQGPTVMKGYWGRRDATRSVLTPDGWLATGDLGRFDEDGDLFIVDRLKDLILRGGYNVYPAEVEKVLSDCPGVLEVAVVGLPDDHLGEEIAAVVVLRPGATLHADDIVAWAGARLSRYKVPRVVRFVPELPKGATGKVLKRAIDRPSLR